MRIARWIFESEERLKVVAAALAVAALVLLVSLMMLRIGSVSASPGPEPSTPAVVHTELLPPTEAATAASPAPSYGSPAPIALVAVEAWLQGDLERFASVATPAATEAVASVQSPGGRTGDVDVLDSGPTQQTLRIATTGGDMELIMVILEERWQVASIRYEK